MNRELEKQLELIRPEAVATLQKWIRQPSVPGTPAPGAPFGPDIRKMLDVAMEDMKGLGFDVFNSDGFAMHADAGEGGDREALGILGHLDVVPVGEGWTMEPFCGEIRDGRIWGRGSSDDKGPMAAAAYALAAVRRAGIPLKRKVRLVFGCDEETGTRSLDYYKKTAVMPRSGFSPDADYPVINLEKGGCHVRLEGPLSGEGVKLKRFNTGHAVNVIPGEAEAEVYGDEALAALAEAKGAELGFETTASCSDGMVTVKTVGVQGHAAMGDNCRNAIGQMLLILKAIGVGGAVAELADLVGMTYHGEALGIAVEDALSGKLTCSMDIIHAGEDTGKASVILDIRYPLLMSVDSMMTAMTMTLNGRLEATLLSSRTPHFVSAESDLVKGLLAAYEEITGEKGKALAIGGGTYAREMEEGVAFGALFPGDREMAHQPDEYMDLERFYQNMRIIACAIVKLAGA